LANERLANERSASKLRSDELTKQIDSLNAERIALRRQLDELNKNILELSNRVPLLADQRFQDFKNKEVAFIKKQFEEVAKKEAHVMLNNWKVENEILIRQDAINRSQAVILGKVTEHILPFHPHFPFNPKEAQ
jgi:predicted Holliday junction resolvase-like endonuclease